MTRLAQHVLPVVAVGPEFGVLPRHVHGPERTEAEEILATKNADHNDRAIHEQVGREFFAETDDWWRFPTNEVGGGREMFAGRRTGIAGRVRVVWLRLRIGAVRGGTI